VSEPGTARLTAWLRGRVQGVGMRWSIRARALELGLTGWARNTDDGRVEVVAEGSREALEKLLDDLRSHRGLPGRIDTVVERWSAASGTPDGFAER
jgi:acylphosphatase